MQLIERVELTSSQASITFSNIPQDGTDLLLVYSLRGDNSANYQKMTFNGSGANFTQRELQGDGSSAGSGSRTDGWIRASVNPSTFSASTFSNAAIYIPNYTSSNNKSFSVDTVVENNATTGYQWIIAGLWSQTPAITSIALGADSNFVSGSSATLYKITKGSDGTTTVA